MKNKTGTLVKTMILALGMMLTFLPGTAVAQGNGDSGGSADLAAASQNPIASLISIPFQFNFNFNNGDFNRMQTVINIQPVIPYAMTEKWNIINRVIIPVIAQPDVTMESGSTGGIGNTNYTAFFAPPSIKKTSIGFGPSFGIPTRTNEKLGPPEFTMGPSVVLFSGAGKFTFGFVTAQNWSIINDNLSSWFVQYFLNYNLPKSWAIGTAPSVSANWNAPDGQKWIVPFGLSVSKVQSLGKQPAKFSLAGYGNAIRPDGGPGWQLQASMTLLFPK